MQFLFDSGYSGSMIKAIQLLLNLDRKTTYSVQFYDANLQEETLSDPVIFLIDESSRGVKKTTRQYAEIYGYRVFAFKVKKGEKRKLFEDALTILSLFPKALELAKSEQSPFLYTFRQKSNKFTKMKIEDIDS